MRYPGQEFRKVMHVQGGILVRNSVKSCTYREVSWSGEPVESCTVRYPGQVCPGSHVQEGIQSEKKKMFAEEIRKRLCEILLRFYCYQIIICFELNS